MRFALAFCLALFSPAQGLELSTGWTMAKGWKEANHDVPASYDDGYNPMCDLKSNAFQIGNVKEHEMPDRKSFSWVSVIHVVQVLFLMLITLVLPPKFPVSPWQNFRAPKNHLISHLQGELLKVQSLVEGNEGWFMHGGKNVKEGILKDWLSILEGKDGDDRLKKAKDKLLVWSDDADEFTARSLEQLANRSAQSVNLENMEPVEWWARTQLFRCCYDPQDPFRVLGFNLAMAHTKSLDFDKEQATKFMDIQMKRPASKIGIALPWSQSMQILIATASALSAPFLPILSMFKRRFWLWYTPAYWALSFRPPVLLEVVFNVLKAYVGLMAWDKLTANEGAVWVQTREFPWFRRLVGGPFQRFANVPIYGLFSQIALQVNFVPAFIFHIVALAGLLAALLGCQFFLIKLFERCSTARWSGGGMMSESLLNAPRSPEQHFNAEPSRTDAFAVFRRFRSQAEAEARKHLTSAKDAWQRMTESDVCRKGNVQSWRDASLESRRFIIALLINAVIFLPLAIPFWLSLVRRWQPDSSDTYFCTFSRLQIVSLHVDTISGFAFLLILASFAIGLMLVLLQGTKILTAVVDVSTNSLHMFLWQSFQQELSMEEALDAFNNQRNMSHAVCEDHEGNQKFTMWWMPKFLDGDAIPPKLRTQAFYVEVVKQGHEDKSYLHLVPEDMKTEAVCIEAVKQNGNAIDFVPEDMKTEAVCIEAFKQNVSTLAYFPENMKTEAIFIEAVKQDVSYLKYVPKDMKTEVMCTEAVKQGGYALEYVPENMKTEAMCIEAVKQDGFALQYVRENMKTEAMCIEAVKQDGFALEYVPENMKTEAVCIEAVKQNGEVLKFVPKDMKTEAMCIEAVKQAGWALYFVPENMKTEAMCIEAVKQKGRALGDVPENMRTKAMCIEAVKQEFNAIVYVPEDMRDSVGAAASL